MYEVLNLCSHPAWLYSCWLTQGIIKGNIHHMQYHTNQSCVHVWVHNGTSVEAPTTPQIWSTSPCIGKVWCGGGRGEVAWLRVLTTTGSIYCIALGLNFRCFGGWKLFNENYDVRYVRSREKLRVPTHSIFACVHARLLLHKFRVTRRKPRNLFNKMLLETNLRNLSAIQ